MAADHVVLLSAPGRTAQSWPWQLQLALAPETALAIGRHRAVPQRERFVELAPLLASRGKSASSPAPTRGALQRTCRPQTPSLFTCHNTKAMLKGGLAYVISLKKE